MRKLVYGALFIVGCGGGIDQQQVQNPNPTGSASTTGGGTAKAISFAKSPDSLKVDKIGGSDGALKPDGNMDAAFTAEVEGPFNAVFVVSTDVNGKNTGDYQWDTMVANQEMPPEMKGLVKSGGMTGGVGVFENGQPLNKADGSMPLIAGHHKIDIYISNVGAFSAGAYFQLILINPDNSAVKGPIAPY